MTSTLHKILPIAVLALSMAACASPRKASDRRCDKAERIRQKAKVRAAALCPASIAWDSVTTRFELPADTTEVELHWTDAEVDSILAACAQLQEALQIERHVFGLLREAEQIAVIPPSTSPPVKRAVQAIRNEACTFEAFEIDDARVRITVRPGQDRPLITVISKPLNETRTIPCPPQDKQPPCPEPGVAGWYRTAFWIVAVPFLLILIAAVSAVLRFRWPG